MALYLASLERLLARPQTTLLPAHGPAIPDGHAKLARVSRTPPDARGAVVAALGDAPRTVGELVARAYGDTPRAVAARRALAARTSRKLVADGRAREVRRALVASDVPRYSGAAVGLTFDALPEVALARDLLRRWWGLELGLSERDGGGYVRTSHATCETLHGLPRRVRARARARAPRRSRRRRKGAIVQRCHAGLTIVAAPVLGATAVAGVVYASGARDGAGRRRRGADRDRDRTRRGAARWPQSRRRSTTPTSRVADLVAAAAAAVERAQPAVVPPTTFTHPFTEIVGDAPAVRDVVKLLSKVVKSEATVLIHGESGTGKELIARAIHYHGPRAKKPFVVQNCSAFNDNLLESALFGHVRGAFTGAVKDQTGLFEVADGGTFFLDEIGDMSAALQVKLLRVLQEGTFMPVGGTKPVKVDVRIIAASHKDLADDGRAQAVPRGPVLSRQRPQDHRAAAARARRATSRGSRSTSSTKHWRRARATARRGSSQGALARLVAYPWPGNIRELENEIERMLVLAGDAHGAHRVDGVVARRRRRGRRRRAPLRDVVATAEADAIVAALGRHIGDRDAAAAELGVRRLPRCATRCPRSEDRVKACPDLQEAGGQGRQQVLPVLQRALSSGRPRALARRGVPDPRGTRPEC